MSSLAGWCGNYFNKPELLQRMADVMSGPEPMVEEYHASDFAVTTTRPAVAADGSYVAACEDDNIIVAFSGYLYSEDIEQRHRPAKHCLKLYRDLGTEFARELNGSFAIVINDKRACKLLLITDRLATKALYYSCQEDFLFASEVKAILQYPGISRKLSEDRLREFLVMGQVLGHNTYYDHISQVPPASVVIWDDVECHSLKYWEPRFSWTNNCDIREHAGRVVTALRGAVHRSCMGGHRVGLMLSGGLDSRVIAATSGRDLLCMTIATEEGFEVATARKVARALGYEHVFIKLPQTYALELLKAGSLIGDGMYMFHNAHPLTLSNLLRVRGIDILLNGWSLDVYFGGKRLPKQTVGVLGRKLHWPLLASPDTFSVCACFMNRYQTATMKNLRAILGSDVAAEAIEVIQAQLAQIIDRDQAAMKSKYDAVDWLEVPANAVKQAFYLTVLTIDRLLPAAIPAHDNEVIDAFLATPPHYRFNHRVYAYLYEILDSNLRAIAYTRTMVPISTNVWGEFLRSRSRMAGREIGHKLRRLIRLSDSKSYWNSWPNAGSTMRECQQWRETLWEYASDSYLAAIGVVSGDGLRTLIGQHLSGHFDHQDLLKCWLTLEEWLRHYG